MTNTVNAAIAQTLKVERAGSFRYNLVSQHRCWINQASSESERIAEINEAYRIFVKHGIIKA